MKSHKQQEGELYADRKKHGGTQQKHGRHRPVRTQFLPDPNAQREITDQCDQTQSGPDHTVIDGIQIIEIADIVVHGIALTVIGRSCSSCGGKKQQGRPPPADTARSAGLPAFCLCLAGFIPERSVAGYFVPFRFLPIRCITIR